MNKITVNALSAMAILSVPSQFESTCNKFDEDRARNYKAEAMAFDSAFENLVLQ